MKVLLTGASGFIGSHLQPALQRAGHHVVCVGRRAAAGDAARASWVQLDFATARPADWARALRGIDVVINAAGIFKASPVQSFNAVHVHGPRTLFEACAAARIGRVIQVSALGADAEAASAYHLSKRAADEHLLGLPLDATVVMPSLVFGAGGASAAFFLALASLPLLPLPGRGQQALQPVHIDDAVEAIVALLGAPASTRGGQRIPLVGPRPLSLAAYLQALRQAMQLGPAHTLPIPAAVVSLVARAADAWPRSLFDSAAWHMLQRGNTAPAQAVGRLLGRAPREARHFLPPAQAPAWRATARLAWLLPLMRLALALVWIVTGIVSLGLYPVPDSLALLARAGVPAPLQPLMLYGAAGLNIALGVLSVWPMRRRQWLWAAQAGLIGVYTAIISLRLPEFWLHPYGPLLKNLPMLALLLLLAALDPPRERRWNT